MTNEEKENLSALANLMGVFGAEMKYLDSGYVDKPSTGSGVELDVNHIIKQQVNSNNSVAINNFPDQPSKKVTLTNKSPTHQIHQTPTISSPIFEDNKILEELQGIKEILNKINNNVGKISGMAGKIFSNLNTSNKL